MTSNQPIHGHGGNAKIDEEVTTMVSKAIASLDAWLEQAEAVLTEQRELGLAPSQVAPEPETEENAAQPSLPRRPSWHECPATRY